MPVLDEQDLPPPMEGSADYECDYEDGQPSHEDEETRHEGNTLGNMAPNSETAEMSPYDSATNNVQPATSARSRKKSPAKEDHSEQKGSGQEEESTKGNNPI